jgi:hypothetical protein
MAKPDWLTIDGIGTGSPTFSCTANTGGQRDYSFKLVQDETGDELDIVITQPGGFPSYTFLVDGKSFDSFRQVQYFNHTINYTVESYKNGQAID